jgi:ADP-ribose pyrophosphatase YjhB (NUDIX family)
MRPVAVKAFVLYDTKILAIRELGNGDNQYTVPGGELLATDAFDEGLIKKVEEQSGLSVFILKPFYIAEEESPARHQHGKVLTLYLTCHAGSDNVKLEEAEYEWINPAEYKDFVVEALHPAFEAFLKHKDYASKED